jgi:hypothetical protein
MFEIGKEPQFEAIGSPQSVFERWARLHDMKRDSAELLAAALATRGVYGVPNAGQFLPLRRDGVAGETIPAADLVSGLMATLRGAL